MYDIYCHSCENRTKGDGTIEDAPEACPHCGEDGPAWGHGTANI